MGDSWHKSIMPVIYLLRFLILRYVMFSLFCESGRQELCLYRNCDRVGLPVYAYSASQREYRWAMAMAMMQINEITSPTAAMGP
jgi:hypothetical protein